MPKMSLEQESKDTAFTLMSGHEYMRKYEARMSKFELNFSGFSLQSHSPKEPPSSNPGKKMLVKICPEGPKDLAQR